MIHSPDTILSEYKDAVIKKKEKDIRFWSILNVITLGLLAIFGGFYRSRMVYLVLFYVVLGFAVVFVIIWLSVLGSKSDEKTLFRMVYADLVDNIHAEKTYNALYQAYPKDDRLKNAGLFARMATYVQKYAIDLTLSSQPPVSFSNTYIYTTSSNGKTTQTYVHFDGEIFRIHQYSPLSFQFRQKGKPHLRGVKFTRHKTDHPFRIFTEEGSSPDHIESKYFALYTALLNRFPSARIYLAGTKGDFYIGITKIPTRKKLSIKKMSLRDLEGIQQELLQKMDLANFIAEYF